MKTIENRGSERICIKDLTISPSIAIILNGYFWSKTYSITIIIVLFLAIFLFFRAGDCNYRTNYVPYQVGKDTYSILPVNSIYLAFGDNERFQGRYIKLVGRYREDICHLNAVTLQERVRGMQGCRDISYSSISPPVFINEFDDIMPFMVKGRFYSDAKTSEYFPLERLIDIKGFSFVQVYLPKDGIGGYDKGGSTIVDSFLFNRLPLADKLINPDVCVLRLTDDIFTSHLCDKYVIHFKGLIRSYAVNK